MRKAWIWAMAAVIGAGLAACSDDDSSNAVSEEPPALVATGAFIGADEAAFLCQALDESAMAGCQGYRVMMPASASDVLRDAGIELREGFRDDLRADQVTLRFDELSFDTDLGLFRADEVSVVDAGEPTPDETLVGEGEFEPLRGATELGSEALDALAADLAPSGTVRIYVDRDEGSDPDDLFGVYTMLPLTDEARELLISTLSGEISVTTWASFAE